MTVEMVFRVLGVALAPLITLLLFLAQEGRKRTRETKQLKAVGELVELTPTGSRVRGDLLSHFENLTDRFLDNERRRLRRDWGALRSAVLLALAAGWLWTLVWAGYSAPRDRASWTEWLFQGTESGGLLAVVLLMIVVPVTMESFSRAFRFGRSFKRPPSFRGRAGRRS
ncbi:hypothetical protein NLX83_37555 [Allokutzneria sp. A3M-2-11 16]|uniref:hypothetical protein n=1 Tax=Allokutzneria sp. A3M-2-11 16 TaxID=2962043 RepID=UPI0020B7461E|nr:hypothetical protein [Allokutzneria sp. A3M-2-11 16]MCP3804989.1 hypothetical protein [Allokutzneria sp. A3M-2-11 16]